MQDKMATRNRVVNALYSATFYAWFPLFRAMTRVLPRRWLEAIARQTVGRFFRCRPKYLRAIRDNFAQIFGEAPDSPRVVAAAREMINQHSYHWIDFFYVSQRTFPEAQALIAAIEGYERIIEAERRGKGVILATAHLGNWYLGGMLLGGLDHPIHVVLKPDRFPIVEKFRSGIHRKWGVEEIPVGETFLSGVAVVQALARGQILGSSATAISTTPGSRPSSSGGRRSSREVRSRPRWCRAPPFSLPSFCGRETATGSSSGKSCRSRVAESTRRTSRQTSSAGCGCWRAMSAGTRPSGTASTRSGTTRAGPGGRRGHRQAPEAPRPEATERTGSTQVPGVSREERQFFRYPQKFQGTLAREKIRRGAQKLMPPRCALRLLEGDTEDPRGSCRFRRRASLTRGLARRDRPDEELRKFLRELLHVRQDFDLLESRP